MVRRLLHLLLIPALLVNQGLLAVHAHAAPADAESEQHRPHFHLGGHGHAAHGHAHGGHCGHAARLAANTGEPAMAPLAEHDASAIYIAELTSLPQGGAASWAVILADFAPSPISGDCEQREEWLLRLGLLAEGASAVDDACPIYLRTLSLRN